MTTVQLTSSAVTGLRVDALVVGIGKGADGVVLAPGADDVDKALGRKLLATATALGATGAESEVTKIPTLGATRAATVVAVGLGDVPVKGDGWRHESIRRAAGAAARGLAGTASLATTLAMVNGGKPSDTDLRAVAEGLALGGYAFTRYRSPASAARTKAPVGTASIVVPSARDRAARRVVDKAAAVVRAVELARDLVNTPAADLHPADLAKAAVDACKPLGLSVEVLDEKALKKGGYGGILGVGQGAAHPPRLVRIGYTHRKAGTSVHLVGKGITFDSGGLSLKPADSMPWMKSDMGGAAAVIATMVAVAAVEPELNLTGWVPTAENMPGGTAIRPSDVLTMYGGKTVEVLNTDAEGRLIMADAIVRAGEENADVIVDVATLTGAQLVALGSRTFAIMANDDDLRAALTDAAGRTGELAWPMPLPQELRKSLDSEVADLSNLGERYGGMLVAGIFLREFVPPGTKWAHLDIAGPAFNQDDAWAYTPKGGTGVPVRTLVEWLESVAAR